MSLLDNFLPDVSDFPVMALRTVAVLLAPQVAAFEFGVLHEVFGIDRTAQGVPAFDFRVCTEHPERPVDLLNGLSLTVPHGLDALVGADLVAVPATVRRDFSPALLEALRRAHAAGATILSVCSGSFVLGAAGLLDGRACATHWMNTQELAAAYPLAGVDRDVLFVDTGDVITSAGTAAGIDACLHLVRRELGASVATAIARRMVVPPQRDGGQRQFVDTPIPACTADSLSGVLAWMLEHLDTDQPVGDARAAGGHVGTHLRPPLRRRDRHHPGAVGRPPAGPPGPRAARGQRPRHRAGGDPQRLRQRGPAAPPLPASGGRAAHRLPAYVQPRVTSA